MCACYSNIKEFTLYFMRMPSFDLCKGRVGGSHGYYTRQKGTDMSFERYFQSVAYQCGVGKADFCLYTVPCLKRFGSVFVLSAMTVLHHIHRILCLLLYGGLSQDSGRLL